MRTNANLRFAGIALLILPPFIRIPSPPTAEWPPAVAGAAMTFDADRGLTLLYGGTLRGGATPPPILWGWDGTAWKRLDEHGPAIENPMLAWDAARHVAVAYGSSSSGGQTWEWDGKRWRQADAASAPGSLHLARLVWDPARARVLLFGGWDLNASRTTDAFWSWDGRHWSRIEADGPEPRAGAALGLDAIRERIVVHGGTAGDGSIILTDTWAWDGTNWSRQQAAGPALAGSALVTTSDALLLLGGWGGSSQGIINRVWRWDTSRWVDTGVRPPPQRLEYAAVSDIRRQRIILFGGTTPSGENLADLWEFDGREWTEVRPSND